MLQLSELKSLSTAEAEAVGRHGGEMRATFIGSIDQDVSTTFSVYMEAGLTNEQYLASAKERLRQAVDALRRDLQQD